MGKFFESELVRQELEEIGISNRRFTEMSLFLTCLVRTNWNMLTN